MLTTYRFIRAREGGYHVLTRDKRWERQENWEDGELKSVEMITHLTAERAIGRVEQRPYQSPRTYTTGRRWYFIEAEHADHNNPVHGYTTRKAAAEALEERAAKARRALAIVR